MDLSAVITQLRTYCPTLAFVGGAADFSLGLETVVNPAALPAAFVIPLAEDADDNELQNALRQEVRERCGVIVWFDNTADRRGQELSNQVDAMKYAIFQALLNWRIDPIRAQKGLQYAGSRFIDMDRARLFYQFDFELITTIMDTDGYQITGVPLTDIQINIELDYNPPVPDVYPPLEVDVYLLPGGNFATALVASAESGAGSVTASDSIRAAVIELPGVGGTGASGAVTPFSGLRMALPAYFTPGSGYWAEIIVEPASGYVIMNSDNGPGVSYDPTYAAAIAATQATGLKVLGYVYSSYAARSSGVVEADIATFKTWYNVDGIFIDQCSGLTADKAYYQGLIDYIRSTAGTFCVLNPGGEPTDLAYMTMADSVCIFEGDYATYVAWTPPGWLFNYSPSEITYLVYNCATEGNMDNAVSLARAWNAGYVYITNDVLPNPWDTLPPYWSAELTQLGS